MLPVISGVGVDVVDLERFRRQLERTPALRDRLFTPEERSLPVASLAARFAAKEALVKALGGSHGFGWQDLAIVKDELGRPSFALTGSAEAHVEEAGIGSIHVSMSHDGPSAIAFVVVEAGA